MPKALMLPLTLLFAMPGCALFAPAPPIVTTSGAGCSALLPADWKAGVDGAPLPVGAVVGDWIAFADAQTARLDAANDRTRASIEIVERCESRDQQAIRQATRRRFLGL